jgi:hypothetical protein
MRLPLRAAHASLHLSAHPPPTPPQRCPPFPRSFRPFSPSQGVPSPWRRPLSPSPPRISHPSPSRRPPSFIAFVCVLSSAICARPTTARLGLRRRSANPPISAQVCTAECRVITMQTAPAFCVLAFVFCAVELLAALARPGVMCDVRVCAHAWGAGGREAQNYNKRFRAREKRCRPSRQCFAGWRSAPSMRREAPA